MRLERKLRAWEREGLIDQATAERIVEFERGARRPVVLYALVGLGALAIGVGIIAIIAANWDRIPAGAKLTVDLLLGLALAGGAYRTWSQGLRAPTEGLVLVYYLFVLASIGLIGQIYQTSAPIHQVLLFWSGITFPMMLLVRSGFGGAHWLVALAATYVATSIDIIENWPGRVYGDVITDRVATDISLLLAFCAAPLFLLLSAVPWFRRERPHVASVFARASSLVIAGSAFAVCFLWYESIKDDELATWAGIVCAAIALALIITGPRIFGVGDRRKALAARVAFAAYGFAWLLPITISHDSLDLLGALSGLGVLVVYAWVAVVFGSTQAFNLLTLAIAVRVVTIYFEVFGSLMSTGLGLVSGGVVVLLAAWLWWRISSNLRRELGAEEASDGS